jgi:uridylate kinase
MSHSAKYKRVLLKLSGEMLQGHSDFGIDPVFLSSLAQDIAELSATGVELAIVIGGGNLFRGATLSAAGLDRVTGDQMGMMATVMNGLALSDALRQKQQEVEVLSALPIVGVVEAFEHRHAIDCLRAGKIAIFVGGVGNPFFTTDTTATLRAIQISADLMMKATKVNGIYSADPIKYPDATRYDKISYDRVIQEELRVMDLSAICMCRDYHLPVRVFDLLQKHAMRDIVLGHDIGTLVTSGESI